MQSTNKRSARASCCMLRGFSRWKSPGSGTTSRVPITFLARRHNATRDRQGPCGASSGITTGIASRSYGPPSPATRAWSHRWRTRPTGGASPPAAGTRRSRCGASDHARQIRPALGTWPRLHLRQPEFEPRRRTWLSCAEPSCAQAAGPAMSRASWAIGDQLRDEAAGCPAIGGPGTIIALAYNHESSAPLAPLDDSRPHLLGDQRLFLPPEDPFVVSVVRGAKKVWDAETGQGQGALFGPAFGLSSALYSPDARRPAVGSGYSVNVSDAEARREPASLPGSSKPVSSAACGRQVANRLAQLRPDLAVESDTGELLPAARGRRRVGRVGAGRAATVPALRDLPRAPPAVRPAAA
jgi:hypothetical protein